MHRGPAVDVAKANLAQAKLNLGYTRITTPVTGISSFARVQDGQYENATDAQLTYVAQMDPMWVNFGISENERLSVQAVADKGRLRLPANQRYEVEIVLGDGTTYPQKGVIDFANADFDRRTGTYNLRATLPNSRACPPAWRVRARARQRDRAPERDPRAAAGGAAGRAGSLRVRRRQRRTRRRSDRCRSGPWYRDDWFILSGLSAGDVVLTDGVVRLSPGAPVRIVEAAAKGAAAEGKATPTPPQPVAK